MKKLNYHKHKFFIFALTLTFFSIKFICPHSSLSVTLGIKNDFALSLGDHNNPASEVEDIYFSGTAIGYAKLQKKVGHPRLFSVFNSYEKKVAENFLIRESASLYKNHLFYIYPSHNFW